MTVLSLSIGKTKARLALNNVFEGSQPTTRSHRAWRKMPGARFRVNRVVGEAGRVTSCHRAAPGRKMAEWRRRLGSRKPRSTFAVSVGASAPRAPAGAASPLGLGEARRPIARWAQRNATDSTAAPAN